MIIISRRGGGAFLLGLGPRRVFPTGLALQRRAGRRPEEGNRGLREVGERPTRGASAQSHRGIASSLAPGVPAGPAGQISNPKPCSQGTFHITYHTYGASQGCKIRQLWDRKKMAKVGAVPQEVKGP